MSNTNSLSTPITVAYGDGESPKLMEITLDILRRAGANISIDTIEIGQELYKQGFTSGAIPSSWEKLQYSRILLKAPTFTPYSSNGIINQNLYLTLQKKLNPYIKIQPIEHITIISNATEIIHSAIKYSATPNTEEQLSLTSHNRQREIIEFTFEYAHLNSHKKIFLITSNPQKNTRTDSIFQTASSQFPEIEIFHLSPEEILKTIIASPKELDIILPLSIGEYTNAILQTAHSTLTPQQALLTSVSLGNGYAIFTADHTASANAADKGSDGQKLLSLINTAITMLSYIGQGDIAQNIKKALLNCPSSSLSNISALQQNIISNLEKLTSPKGSKKSEESGESGDSGELEGSEEKSSTNKQNTIIAFPFSHNHINHQNAQNIEKTLSITQHDREKIESTAADNTKESEKQRVAKTPVKELVGVDIFVDTTASSSELDDKIHHLHREIQENKDPLSLCLIHAQGVKIWPYFDKYSPPSYSPEYELIALRFTKTSSKSTINNQSIINLLQLFTKHQISFVKTTNLYNINGNLGYSELNQ